MQQLFMPLDTTVNGGDGQVTLGEQVIMKQKQRARSADYMKEKC